MYFLKELSIGVCMGFILLACQPVTAQEQQKSFPIESIVAAKWIDHSSSTMSLTFLSVYPNGCYSFRSSTGFTSTADRKIYVSQTVSISEGFCTMALVSQTDETAILVPEAGEYTVVDLLTNKTLGLLVVNEGQY